MFQFTIHTQKKKKATNLIGRIPDRSVGQRSCGVRWGSAGGQYPIAYCHYRADDATGALDDTVIFILNCQRGQIPGYHKYTLQVLIMNYCNLSTF